MGSIIKQIAVLGSTGSIGRQTLEVVRAFPDRFRVIGLAAGNNLDLLTRQIDEFKPRLVCCQNETALPQLANQTEFISLADMAAYPDIDAVVLATAGKAGLKPLLSALKAGKNVALANKEALVMAGEIVMTEARLNNARIMPVDSEHSAIWQCLNGEEQKAARIILTASGGPFSQLSSEHLGKVKAEDALKHPTWRMGQKVTIDSATLMNKGLEVIEAHWLFNISFDDIRVLIHPQSLVHSLVEFPDGAVKAQLSPPDMRLSIQYALSYPQRMANPDLPKLDWNNLKELTFDQPDQQRFPCLELAISAGKQGATYPAVLCAADEIAVALFLEGRIKFNDIYALVSQTLSKHQTVARPSIDDILMADEWARGQVAKLATGDS